MSGDRKTKRPEGYYGKEQRAARAAAFAERKAAAAERQAEQERDEPVSPLRAQAARLLANAKERLRATHAATPVPQFESRMARLAQAQKRERQRFDHLVLGLPRPDPELVRPAGLSRMEWKVFKQDLLARGMKLEPGVEEAVSRREQFEHGQGTPETNAYKDTHHADSILQLERNGTLNKEQVEHVAEISNVHRSIESDVAIKVASFEARVDNSGAGANRAAEGINRVRMHLAYTIWREALPAPKQAILDMIVGDAIGYSVAAKRYRMHARRAKRLLIEAIDRWPRCVDRAFEVIDRDAYGAMLVGIPVTLNGNWRTPVPTDEYVTLTRAPAPAGEPSAPEPAPMAPALPPIDPAFVDDRGYIKPWAEIAEIIRRRSSVEPDPDVAT